MVKRWSINHQSAIATLSPSLQKKMSTKRFARFLNFSLKQRFFYFDPTYKVCLVLASYLEDKIFFETRL